MSIEMMLSVGALAGLGLTLVVVGMLSTTTPLDALVDNLHRPRVALNDTRRDPTVVALLAGRQSAGRDADLAICERTLATLMFGGLPLITGLALGALGGVRIPAPVLLGASVLGAAGGFAFAVQDLHSDGERKRREFRHALGSYLELVTILIAGGRGVESALYDAVELGQGDAYRQLRLALAGAQARRVAPWRALGDLGRRLRVPALEELESSMVLAGESGARVRDSLVSKAKAMRTKDLNEIESEAQARSETMVFPVVLMFAAFLVLVGYPAMAGLAAT
jgi:tight adherence protein C